MNERKELIEYRTSNSKYFLKKDGTIEVEIYDKNILPTSRISVTGSESNTSVIDTYIYSGDTNTSTYNQDILKVGVEKTNNKNTIYRSLLKFELPKIPASYTMINARLNLVGYADTNYKDYDPGTLITVHEVTQNWTESNAKWSNMNNKYNSHIENYFYSIRSQATISGNEMVITPKSFGVDITGLVQKWYNNPSTNYGLMLKAFDETYNANIKSGQFYSKDNKVNGSNPKPRIVITYRNFNGLENYLSYSSQSHELGSCYINNFNGNLTSTFDVANTIGGPLPTSLYLVYNTTDVILNNNYGYGLGIKPNLIQILKETTIESQNMLEYLDEDGTIHYFYKGTDNIYKDEEGLFLKVEKVNDNYIMTDKDKNTNKFINHNGIYYLEEIKDTNNKTITIQYDSNNRISKVIDASNQEINITYETNKITFISPYKNVIVNLTDNKITSIIDLGDTTTITYNPNNLLEKIINSDGTSIKYDYLNDLTYKVLKVTEYGKGNIEGNYLEFTYNVKSTVIKDRKGLVNTYVFNNYGNVETISNQDTSNNIANSYGKSYIYGDRETSSVNKVILDNSLMKYTNNLLSSSSFEGNGDNFYSHNQDLVCSLSTSAHYGMYSLKLTNTSLNTFASLDKQVDKGKYYTFSAFIKNDIPFKLSLIYDDIEENIIINKINDNFQRQEITCFYSDNATSNLKIKITPLAIGNILIDDMQLEEGKVANYYNLMENSSFTNGTTGYEIESYKRNGYEWNYGEPTSINPSVEVVNIDGSKALKLINNPLIQTTISKPFNISGKAGDVYELSFWYKNEGISYLPTEETIDTMPEPAHIAAFLYFNYGNIDDWDGYKEEDILSPYNKDWHFFSKKYVASKDYSDIAFNIQDFFNIDNCYITNISLFKDLESYSYVYDDEGNLVSSVDLSKETSQFAYNSNNQLIEATSPLGKKYKYEYDDNVTDRLIKAISPTGITNSIDYDENNNPIRTRINNTEAFSDIEETNYYIRARGTNAYINIKPDKNLEVLENTCSHDKFKIIILPNDRVKIQYTILNNYYLKDNNSILKLEYGDTNNIFELIKHQNKSYSIKSVTSNLAITVNTNNSLTLTTYNEDNSNQQFLFEKMDSKLFIESSASYSQDGRFINTVKDQLGNITTYNINNTNGLINSIIDPNNKITNYTYDNKFRITNITKENHSVSYEYNNYNNLSKIIHGTKNYIFNYDEFNNTSSVKINNNTLVNNYYENNNGNLNKVLYGNNHEINYTYDSLDRLESIIKSNDTYKNYYDNLGRITKITSNNDLYKYEYDFAKRLSTFKYNNYETNYNYDKENNVIEKIEELNNNKYTYNYEYNNESSLTKLSHNNQDFNYIYDILGRLEESNINNTYKTKYKYITYGNKTSTTIKEVDDNGIIYNYIYDKLGNITEIYKNNSLTNKYYYDTHSQLIKEDNILNNQTILYEYDNYGNILSKKVYTNNTLIKEDTYTYGDTNWQDLLTKYNNESITYDTIGNPTSIGNKTLTWINGRELSSYQDNTNNITYKYNLDGIRTSKIVNGIETKYYLEGTSIIFEDRNGNMIYYIYNGDELLGFIYNSNTYYYHKNIFGDIIGILDSNYNEVVTYTYNSWGLLTNKTDTTTINLSTINPFRYRSYYYDEETNLYYLNSRYYNPEWGRFVNADFSVFSNNDLVSGNLYAYSSNNPVNFCDDSGKSIFSAIGKALKKAVNTVTKAINNIKKNVQKKINSTSKSIKETSSIVTMFAKSFGANNNRKLSSNERKTLEKEFKNSKKINDVITYKIATTPHNQNTFFAEGSFSSSSDDSFLSRAIVGSYDYRIEGTLLQDNMWNIHVYITDTYDFTEKKGKWLSNWLNFLNDMAYCGTQMGIIGYYEWEIDYYISRKDIWR